MPTCQEDRQAEAILARLAAEPGMDIHAGFQALRGKGTRYVRLLRELVAEHSDDIRRLNEALARGDRAGAERIAHNLKGAAGTLGLTGLFKAAMGVDTLLKDESQGVESLAHDMEALAQALAHFMQIMEAHPPQYPDSQIG